MHIGKEAEEFRQWFNDNINKLDVLGDFATKCVYDNQDILRNDWKNASRTILSEFYIVAQMNKPSGVDEELEQTSVEDSLGESNTRLRNEFISLINDAFIRNSPKERDRPEYESVQGKLNYCLKFKLLPWCQKKDENVYINIGFLDTIKNRNIEST